MNLEDARLNLWPHMTQWMGESERGPRKEIRGQTSHAEESRGSMVLNGKSGSLTMNGSLCASLHLLLLSHSGRPGVTRRRRRPVSRVSRSCFCLCCLSLGSTVPRVGCDWQFNFHSRSDCFSVSGGKVSVKFKSGRGSQESPEYSMNFLILFHLMKNLSENLN